MICCCVGNIPEAHVPIVGNIPKVVAPQAPRAKRYSCLTLIYVFLSPSHIWTERRRRSRLTGEALLGRIGNGLLGVPLGGPFSNLGYFRQFLRIFDGYLGYLNEKI